MQFGSSTRPTDLFKEKRVKAHKKAKTLKCQATEAVAVLPVLVAFAMRVVFVAATCPIQRIACLVLLRLLDVVQLILGAQRPMADPDGYAADLDIAVERFLSLFKKTFPVKFMVTKFHSLLHFGDQLRRWRTLLSCWVHERKHTSLKLF